MDEEEVARIAADMVGGVLDHVLNAQSRVIALLALRARCDASFAADLLVVQRHFSEALLLDGRARIARDFVAMLRQHIQSLPTPDEP